MHFLSSGEKILGEHDLENNVSDVIPKGTRLFHVVPSDGSISVVEV